MNNLCRAALGIWFTGFCVDAHRRRYNSLDAKQKALIQKIVNQQQRLFFDLLLRSSVKMDLYFPCEPVENCEYDDYVNLEALSELREREDDCRNSVLTLADLKRNYHINQEKLEKNWFFYFLGDNHGDYVKEKLKNVSLSDEDKEGMAFDIGGWNSSGELKSLKFLDACDCLTVLEASERLLKNVYVSSNSSSKIKFPLIPEENKVVFSLSNKNVEKKGALEFYDPFSDDIWHVSKRLLCLNEMVKNHLQDATCLSVLPDEFKRKKVELEVQKKNVYSSLQEMDVTIAHLSFLADKVSKDHLENTKNLESWSKTIAVSNERWEENERISYKMKDKITAISDFAQRHHALVNVFDTQIHVLEKIPLKKFADFEE